jgi:hypothetical protein
MEHPRNALPMVVFTAVVIAAALGRAAALGLFW